MDRTVVTEPSLLSLDRCEYFSALQLQSFEVCGNAGNDNNEAAIISSKPWDCTSALWKTIFA